MYRQLSYKLVVTFLLLLLASSTMRAEDFQAEDTLAREIHAALIVADPGEVLYSLVGHCAIHMWAPEYNLDYVFSYESEDVRQKVLTFLAGKLKMGMFATPIETYLGFYRPQGRGVRQYMLNLPMEVKRNLWRVLDEHVAQGNNLPYDYLTRGCAHSTLMMLKEGLDTIPIQYGPLPEKFATLSRRELTELQMSVPYPWNWAFMNLIGNGSIDKECSSEAKIIMPADLVSVLSDAKIQGHPLMASEPEILLPSSSVSKRTWFTPLLVSSMFLVLTIVSFLPYFFSKQLLSSSLKVLLLGLQFLIGAITLYLVCFSKLCCTEWSWLIVPFNPLPLLCWYWRCYWLIPYSFLIVVWALCMMLWPHRLTDSTYIVLAIALVMLYINEYVRLRCCKMIKHQRFKL